MLPRLSSLLEFNFLIQLFSLFIFFLQIYQLDRQIIWSDLCICYNCTQSWLLEVCILVHCWTLLHIRSKLHCQIWEAKEAKSVSSTQDFWKECHASSCNKRTRSNRKKWASKIVSRRLAFLFSLKSNGTDINFVMLEFMDPRFPMQIHPKTFWGTKGYSVRKQR